MNHCSAILLAAGKSQRLGFDKILTPLCGQPVLIYSLQSLLNSPLIHEVIIVTRQDIIPAIESLVAGQKPVKNVRVIQGGAERQDSVYLGLKSVAADSTHILIHDAARPLLSLSMIEKSLIACEKTGAAVVARRATDTLKKVSATDEIEATLDRSTIWLVETPQVFHKKIITESYERVITKKAFVTDDASTVELAGGTVFVVESDTLNLKITRTMDWEILELWLKKEGVLLIREDIHHLSNELSPLIGYLPLLEKYGGHDEKFLNYLSRCIDSARGVQTALHALQTKTRNLFANN